MPTEISNTPRFAVVGHPNKGKSSIVATLARDDSIYIDRLSGSTTKSQSFPMTVDGTKLYELIDTPGFQRARTVLTWLQNHCQDISKRNQAVGDFYSTHREDSRFNHELELLKPILDGAGIIYVVDGSRPFGPEYEAEMEILRWTGRPSLALINPIDNEDYVEQWRNALGQYFKTVRVFNAQTAEFTKCISLLEVFGQLDPDWQQRLKQAAESLKLMRSQQHKQASQVISDCLVDMLQHSEKQALPNIKENVKAENTAKYTLTKKYQHTLRQTEKRCRQRIAEIYNYYQIKTDETTLEFVDQDLFDQSNWYLFGLNKKQLITTAMAAGASAGALVDVGTGGHSLLLGSALGGIVGGFSAWKFSDQIAKFTIKGLPTGGKTLSYGPVTNVNFPFVVLGRALQHHHLICTRTHAARDVLKISTDADEQNIVSTIEAGKKTELMRLFRDIGKYKQVLKNREKLAEILFGILQTVDA